MLKENKLRWASVCLVQLCDVGYEQINAITLFVLEFNKVVYRRCMIVVYCRSSTVWVLFDRPFLM
jgi:hypothetical protein